MKKLEIIITHYNEGFGVLKPLLDSINIQQDIDFKDIGVTIVNDGNLCLLAKEYFTGYKFDIHYFIKEHNGVSSARNFGFDKSESEYLMFCDCDDMFFSVCALWVIFREINSINPSTKTPGFDVLTSVFIQETYNKETKSFNFINRGDKNSGSVDSTFIHGKVYRRQYLLANKIRWCESLTIHEDSYFNCLCQVLTKNIKYLSNPFYIWKWREGSICRSENYMLRTYTNLLDSSDALTQQYIARNLMDNAKHNVVHMFYNTYFTLNLKEYLSKENYNYRYTIEKRFREYYAKYVSLFNQINPDIKVSIIKQLKNTFYSKGLIMESFTFESWIMHIINLK